MATQLEGASSTLVITPEVTYKQKPLKISTLLADASATIQSVGSATGASGSWQVISPAASATNGTYGGFSHVAISASANPGAQLLAVYKIGTTEAASANSFLRMRALVESIGTGASAIPDGAFQLSVCSDTAGATPVATYNLQGAPANTDGFYQELVFSASAAVSAIQSVSLSTTANANNVTYGTGGRGGNVNLGNVSFVSEIGAVVPFTGESLKMSRNLLQSKTIRATRDAAKPVRGNVDLAGDINVELSPNTHILLRQLFGSTSYTRTVGTGANGTPIGAYKYVFKVGKLAAGLNIEKQFNDDSIWMNYGGVRINSFKLSTKPEGFIECTFSTMGAREDIASDVAYSNSNPISYEFAPFDGFSAEIKVADPAGGAGIVVGVGTSLIMTFNNTLDGNNYVIGGRGVRHSLPAGIVSIDGTMEVLFEDLTYYNMAVSNSTVSLKLTLQNGPLPAVDMDGTVNDYAAEDGYDSTLVGLRNREILELYFPEILFKPESPVINGPLGLTTSLPFVAFYNSSTEASSIQMSLTIPIATIF